MANVMIFVFHNDIHDSFNFIHGVQLMLSWQQWLYSISRSFSLLMQFESSLSGMKGSSLVNAKLLCIYIHPKSIMAYAPRKNAISKWCLHLHALVKINVPG